MSDATAAEVKQDPWWADPKVSNTLMMLTYLFGGIGIGVGVYGLTQGGGPKALHWALPLMVGAVGVLSLVRHSAFHVSDARRAGVEGSPFFMIELGFANGAMGILALVVFFGTWGVAAEVALMLAYGLYLGMAFFIFLYKVKAKGFDGGSIFGLCMWAVEVGFMFYFAIAAAIAAKL